MNKFTLAINVWRAYTAARRTEGSSLVGKILMGISVLAIILISLLHGNLTADDVGIIVNSIMGLAGALFYIIPDRLGAVTLTAERGETNGEPLPPINLIAESQAIRTDDDLRLRPGDNHPDSDRMPQRAVRPIHNTDEAADKEAADEHEQPGFNG